MSRPNQLSRLEIGIQYTNCQSGILSCVLSFEDSKNGRNTDVLGVGAGRAAARARRAKLSLSVCRYTSGGEKPRAKKKTPQPSPWRRRSERENFPSTQAA